jgi:prepilin-type N-terminal cleavage/methylation domain-containing protein
MALFSLSGKNPSSFKGNSEAQMIIKNEKGFTLVELLIGAMIVAILGAIAAPQFTGLLRSFRLKGAATVIWGDLHKARLMAIKENRSVRVDFTSNAYDIVRVNTAEVVFRRNLAADYPGITVSIPSNTITFGSTGTAGGGSKTVQVQSATGMKSFTILTTGRIETVS